MVRCATMTKPMLLALSVFLLLSCGQADSAPDAGSTTPVVTPTQTPDQCVSPVNGNWVSTTGAAVSLSSQCAFGYVGASECQSFGYYAKPLGSSGSIAVQVASETGSGCLPAGNYDCNFSVSSDTLTFDCGAGTETYTRTQ